MGAILLENWTRWRLVLDSGETVPPHSALSLAPGRFPLVAWFSWRPDYKERLSVEPETGAVEAETSKPWYSRLGIYHHYTLQVDSGGGVVRLVPRFVFGLAPAQLSAVFPAADSVPVRGVISATTAGDRLLVQTLMAGIAVAVVVLLNKDHK